MLHVVAVMLNEFLRLNNIDALSLITTEQHMSMFIISRR